MRSQHYELIKDEICDSFDMAVPVSHVSDFILKLKELAAEYHTDTNIIAHIADGNVHNDILYLPDGTIPDYADELKHRMYQLCAGFDGTAVSYTHLTWPFCYRPGYLMAGNFQRCGYSDYRSV